MTAEYRLLLLLLLMMMKLMMLDDVETSVSPDHNYLVAYNSRNSAFRPLVYAAPGTIDSTAPIMLLPMMFDHGKYIRLS